MTMKYQFSDEDINRIDEDAQAYRKEYKERGFQSGVPICFLGDGTYIFRIYPDRDSKGFIRLIKRAWIHQRIPVGEKKLRFWKDERVDRLFTEAEDAGMEKIFGKPIYHWKAREQGYMMAHVFECPESEWTKPRQSYGVVLDRRQMFAIHDFVAELHPDDKRQMLDPNSIAPGIKLSITRGSGKANVSCGIAGMQKLELPDLQFKDDEGNPIEYTGLDSIYITEGQNISDEDFFMLKKAVYDEIANWQASGGQAKDKSAEAHKFGDKAADPALKSSTTSTVTADPQPAQAQTQPQSQPQTTAVVTAVATDEIQCRLADQCKNNPKMAEAYPGVSFGNKPSRSTPYCLACDFEEECRIATEKKKKAA